ncbi:MAG: hypothetical protein WDO71_26730 [Bacteroidota bacterium]
MKLIPGLLGLLLLFSACEKSTTSEESFELYGRYRGTFTRSGMDTALVNIFFKNDATFDGTSDSYNIPQYAVAVLPAMAIAW